MTDQVTQASETDFLANFDAFRRLAQDGYRVLIADPGQPTVELVRVETNLIAQ